MENVAGQAYVEAISALPSDRDARLAFQNLALSLVPRGATVFDFGCGPGIDARFYAKSGFKVHAYDVDPIMCDYFAAHCQDLIQDGLVALSRGSYAEFMAQGGAPAGQADLITSNFAPLSLVSNLEALFEKFQTLTTPGGLVLASVLNPYCRGDLRYVWWWRNLIRLGLAGEYAVAGAQAPIVRRRLACLARRCQPFFSLERVYAGLPPRGRAEAAGIDLGAGVRGAWRSLTRSQFLFLLYRKRVDGATRCS
jgi:SAM-dependent methyltransferase